MSRILWFHPRPWGPPRGGGDLRTQGLIRCALAAGHQVDLVAPASQQAFPRPAGLSVLELRSRAGMGLAAAKLLSSHPLRSPRVVGAGRRETELAIRASSPDVAVVSEVMSWSIAALLLPPEVPWAYDAVNVESELFRELARRARGAIDRVTFAVDAARVARDEQAMLLRADAVISVSAEEREVLARAAPGKRVVVVPSSVPDPGQVWTIEGSEPSVLFVGTLDYPPNVDAVSELVSRLMPSVRRGGDARLILVGRRPAPQVKALAAGHPWVELHEDVPDLAPFYLRSRCVVLPIRSGAGTKLKVYEALAYGVPLVATPEAVSGIPVQPGKEALVSSEAESLARDSLRVMSDPVEAARLGAAGREAFVSRLSWEQAAMGQLDELIRTLAGRR